MKNSMIDAKNPHSDPQKEASLHEEAAKLERLAGHARGLFEELTEWFELKLEYTILNGRDHFFRLGKPFAFEVLPAVILALSFMFGLVALALGLGEWLSHPAWGFLLVMVLLMVAAWVVHLVAKRMKTSQKTEKMVYAPEEAQKKLTSPSLPEQPVNAHGKDQQQG